MTKYLSLCFLILFAASAYSQSGLEVASTVIPPAPATARAVGASGLVEILVTIDADGNVASADTFKGHPLLKPISREAVLKWKFNKNENSGELRTANITFDFLGGGDEKVIERSEKQGALAASAKFLTPFWAEIMTTDIIPKLLLLPREEGKIKPEKCELHDEWMQVDAVAVFDENGDREREAIMGNYPNANTVYREETYHRQNIYNKETKNAEVHYCKTCRLIREQWINEHKDR